MKEIYQQTVKDKIQRQNQEFFDGRSASIGFYLS